MEIVWWKSHSLIIWFLLFTAIFGYSLLFVYRLIKIKLSTTLDKKIQLGIMFFLISAFVDMGHYARPLYAPIIDIFSVCLGALSAIYSDFSKIRK